MKMKETTLAPEQTNLIALGLYKTRHLAVLDSTTQKVKLTGVSGNHARYFAYLVTLALRRGDYEDVGVLMRGFCNSKPTAGFLELVADAIKDGSQFEPTSCRRRLIQAHDAAYLIAVKRAVRTRDDGKRYVSVPDLKPPTLQDWKTQFEELFTDVPLPADSTFRRAAGKLSLLYFAPKGRPPGSKDQDRRKRPAGK